MMSTEIAMQGQEFSVPEAISIMEKMSEVMEKAREIALKGTRPEDWTDQGGKPYLTISGSNRIQGIFGVSVTDKTMNKLDLEDENGKYYVITYTATFSWRKLVTTMTGTCSSRDKFFAKDKEQAQVDFTNIIKKAETNCMGRGIKSLLGVGNITWDELEKITGWSRNSTSKITYRDKSQVTDEMKIMQKELRELIMKQANNDVEAAKGILELLTEFVNSDGKKIDGKREVDKLTEKQLVMCLRKLKEGK